MWRSVGSWFVDYDDYDRPHPLSVPEPRTVAEELIPVTSRGPCPECGRIVRFNERRRTYYSHNVPGTTKVCLLSGRAEPLSL
jgi:hypothetical protein